MTLIAVISTVCLMSGMLLYKYFFKRPKVCHAPTLIQNLDEAMILLKTSNLEGRAIPNQRLVETFGLDNSFTTTDREYHKEFLGLAKGLVRTQNSEWKAISLSASNILKDTLGQELISMEPRRVNLVKTVQTLVFRIVLLKFFPSIPKPSDREAEFITSSINDLWIGSKCYVDHKNQSALRARADLESRLRTVFQRSPNMPITGRSNPLNILLPAYETLWRVVLRCFLEVRYKASEDDLSCYGDVFYGFLTNPTKATFNHTVNEISVKYVVNEALRLYPPTRRIYRRIGSKTLGVDVEYIQRNPEYWGDNTLEFDPKRWEGSCGQAYMPFGAGAFECPAKNTFAPMMIGILVGNLLMGCGGSWILVGEDGAQLGLDAGPLLGGRNGYEELYLQKFCEAEAEPGTVQVFVADSRTPGTMKWMRS